MRHWVRAAASILAGGLVVGAATVAAAQTPSIVGIWSHRTVTAQGAVAVIFDEFDANGQLHLRFVTPAGTIDYFGVYQMVNGGTVVRAQLNDYSPKQICTMVCSPVTPTMPIGQPNDSPVRFDGPNVLYFGGDMYTRQQ